MRILPFMLGLILAGPAFAQTEPVPGFLGDAYFEPSNFTLSDTYTFDEDFAEEHDVVVPVPFRLSIPRRDGIEVQTALLPDGGAFVGFTFTSEPTDGFDSLFLEVMQVTDATIPLMAEEADPSQARVQVAAGLLENDFWGANFAAAPEARILAVEEIELGTVPNAVQLIGAYYDPEFDDQMMVRAVILPHPDQPESLLILNQINLDVIPVRDGETLAATTSGRILEEFEYR